MRKQARYLIGAIILSATVLASSESNAVGAFALGRNDDGGWWYGLSWDHNSRRSAREDAMRRCSRRGPRCKVETTFWNKCFAVAFQTRGNGYGWATRDSKREAEQVAMEGCEKHGRDCEIKESICDEVAVDD